jgi:myo-inositol 2-dehydrogenase/D-chiro-inositol 1-dehydrogenase
MRRFDPGYVEMKRRLDEGELGAALVMHCVHRNVAAPSFMTAPMLITNSAVHEIDIARFVLGQEVKRVTVVIPPKTRMSTMQDPQILLLEMDDGVVVDAEIFINAQYGYDVRAELVCEKGTIALTPPHDVTVKHSAEEGFPFPSDWRPRFALAYRAELQAWTAGVTTGAPVGASAWDGYVATAVADAGLRSLASGRPTDVGLEPRPELYG